jgi:hypothetical protein
LVGQPGWLVGLAAVDGAMVFAFKKFVLRQQELIKTTQGAEKSLPQRFPEFAVFVPTFSTSPPSAPIVVFRTLVTLTLALGVYALCLLAPHVIGFVSSLPPTAIYGVVLVWCVAIWVYLARRRRRATEAVGSGTEEPHAVGSSRGSNPTAQA